MEGFRRRILRKDFGRIRGRILAEGRKLVYEINHSKTLKFKNYFFVNLKITKLKILRNLMCMTIKF